MYQGRTLEDLAKELKRQAESRRDFKSPTTILEMAIHTPEGTDSLESEPELVFNVGDKFSGSMTGLMHDHLGKHCGIPAQYYDRMREHQPALLATSVTTWLQSKRDMKLVRTLDGKARAFLSNRYRMINNDEVAEAVLPVLYSESKKLGGISVISSDVTEKKLYVKALSKRLTFEVKKGDVVQAGIMVSNSEVGKGFVRVEPLLYRLICTNGAVIEDSAVKKFHVGRAGDDLEMAEQVFRDETIEQDNKAFVMKLQDVVRAAFSDESFDALKNLTIDSTTRKIKRPVLDVVEEVSKRFGIKEGVKKSFLDNLINGGDMTQWGLANAVTQAANTASDYESATELERIGGTIMTIPEDAWKNLAVTV